jgi:hypothetical protein
MDDSHAAEGLARIGREIQAEKAAALARIAGTLEDLIAQLGRVGREAMEADRAQDRQQARALHSELREKALRYRWYLEVQREAVGFTRHDALDQMYPVPPPLTRGPSPR